ncbi:Very short patch repair protein [Serratia fonticola]|nr:Very short patch repair protein [Serratia fonticola]CAI1999040.1 Very short patch repair protein [Serratia fonticola]CAI1999070.1 Very short patch repair protein [Serratia fonticola]
MTKNLPLILLVRQIGLLQELATKCYSSYVSVDLMVSRIPGREENGKKSMDIVDRKTRSRMMSGIKGKNTQPELIIRRFLYAQGFRYRLHVTSLPGKPDLVLARYKLCIFVHGCFWHRHDGCRYATTPKTRPEFWMKKFAVNRQRDIQVKMQLHAAGWRVFEIWECGFRDQNDESISWLPEFIKSDVVTLSWPDYVCSGDR